MSTGSDAPQSPDQPQQPEYAPPPYAAQPPPGYGPPPMPYPGPPPMRPEDEKLWAIGAHLGPLVLGLFAPLVVWLVFKDRSRFLDRSAKEALNMQISYAVYGLVAGLSILLLVGFILLPLVGIAWLVLLIIGTIKAANLEDWRYPAIFRLVS